MHVREQVQSVTIQALCGDDGSMGTVPIEKLIVVQTDNKSRLFYATPRFTFMFTQVHNWILSLAA